MNKTNEMVWREEKREFEKNERKKEIRGIQNNNKILNERVPIVVISKYRNFLKE
jgi:hypothetical protein